MRARFGGIVFVGSLVAAAGCNLLTGASDLSIGDDDPLYPDAMGTGLPPSPDATSPAADAASDGPSDAATDIDGDAEGGIPGAKRVFVTSTRTTGDTNGFVQADALCASAAASAGLGGTWVAWLSMEGVMDAVDRLTHNGPWYLVDRATLVATKTQLTGTSISHAIDRDEKGVVVNDDVWTGTRAGRFYQNDCNRWNAMTNQFGGTVGRSKETSAAWTATFPASCAQLRRLYCFEN